MTLIDLITAQSARLKQAGVMLARDVLASGKALAKMNQFIARTQELAPR